ncbi:hypothetical protein ACLOJK_034657 [Asimina triloba]
MVSDVGFERGCCYRDDLGAMIGHSLIAGPPDDAGETLPRSLCSGVHCCWIEQGMMKMGAMVDAAADRTWKMHGRGLLLGRSLHGVIGSASASTGVVGRGLILPENGLRRPPSEED